MHEQIKNWLSKDVFPLWLQNGVDWQRGGFIENLSMSGKTQIGTRRAMVQARQLYSFRIGLDLGVAPKEQTLQAILQGTEALLRDYSDPSGCFHHTIDDQGRVVKATPELYTEAFVLFGLAQSYSLFKKTEWKERAKELVAYLSRERRNPMGGYTELGDKGQIFYQSNPHMHLFEAALAWMEIDSDPLWRQLSDHIVQLCQQHMIEASTGLIAEHFNENWTPIRENGLFVFEPGHQYEWSWLMGRYQKMTGVDLSATRVRLFTRSEAHGIDAVRKTAWDQLWSDYSPKSRDSRFWPQCERIKAACQLKADQLVPADVAQASSDEAMKALFRYLQTPTKGLWYDSWDANGNFHGTSVKGSSLYHIIGGMVDYLGTAKANV